MWQDKVLLYRDAARQSPLSAKAQNEYGIALTEKGMLTEAARQFDVARSLDRNLYLVPLNQARIKLLQGDTDGAIALLEKTSDDKESAHPEILRMLVHIREGQLRSAKDKEESARLMKELISLYHYFYLDTKDSYLAYRSGQLFLATGEFSKAAEMFERASRDAPQDAFFKEAAKKLARKLGR